MNFIKITMLHEPEVEVLDLGDSVARLRQSLFGLRLCCLGTVSHPDIKETRSTPR
ncbi:hypothetical protein Mapa_008629 [Marchantia paleacea]|nr:hypothetical protein Mapa_008629 [Marchantia paleacea]